MTDIAHQHQRAARHCQRLAVLASIFPVGIELARDRLAALLECIFEIAIHQAEPVAIDDDLVLRIDGSNGILAILDRRQRQFQQNIGNMRGIRLADRMIGIDDDLDMQAILDQKDCGRRLGIAAITGKLAFVLERNRFAVGASDRVSDFQYSRPETSRPVRAIERRAFIEKCLGPGNDLGAAHGIERLALFGTAVVRNGVRAVESIIE